MAVDVADVSEFFHHDQRLLTDEAALAAMERTPDGLLVGRELAQDASAGSWVTAFRCSPACRAVTAAAPARTSRSSASMAPERGTRGRRLLALEAFANFSYYDQARLFDRGTANGYIRFPSTSRDVRNQVAATIDAGSSPTPPPRRGRKASRPSSSTSCGASATSG